MLRYKLLVGVDARKWNTLYLTERVSQNVTELIELCLLEGEGDFVSSSLLANSGHFLDLRLWQAQNGPIALATSHHSFTHGSAAESPRRAASLPPGEIQRKSFVTLFAQDRKSDPSGGFV